MRLLSRDPMKESQALSWDALLSTYVPALILALGVGIAVPAIPTLAKSFDVSFGVATGVIITFLLGGVAGTIPSGWLSDRFGRRRIMIAGPILTALMAFMVAAAQSFPELLVYRFLDGFAAQMWIIGRLAGISHRAAADQRGRQVSWLFGMDNTGKLLGPLAGGFIAAAWGLRAPFLAYGFLALLALIPTLLLTEDTPRRTRTMAVGAPPRQPPSLRQLVLPRVVYFAVVLFAALARGPIQADLLHLYAAFAYHLGPKEIGLLATTAGIVALPTGFVAGWLMDRFGRKRTMVPGFVGVTIAMAALALSAFAHLPLPWYIALFLLGVGAQALTGGSIQTIGADIAPPGARGMFLGVWRFTGQSGAALSPVIFAALADAVGYGTSFIFIASAAAVVAYLVIRHVPETGVLKNRHP